MRLFVAAFDARLVGEIERRWDELAPDAPFRRVRSEGMHATLAFLGELDEPILPRLKSAIDRAASGIAPFSVELDRVGALGSGRTTRVWVLHGESEPYEYAAGRIRRLLNDFAQSEEHRRAIPHVTLGRSRDLVRIEGRPVSPPLRLDARELTLFQSFLEPGGARYVARHVAPLAGGRPGF